MPIGRRLGWVAVAVVCVLVAAFPGCVSEASPTTTTAVPASTLAPSTTTTVPPSPADALTASLRRLPFDEFVDDSFDALLLRTPQKLTEYGLASHYGLRNDRLNDRSDTFLHETMDLQVAVLELLHTYDRATLEPDQQVAYDVYEWSLDNLIRGHEFIYHDYPLNSFLFSYHFETVGFFTDVFPLETAAGWRAVRRVGPSSSATRSGR
jgi:uncharacterized protein (DUF885 family)